MLHPSSIVALSATYRRPEELRRLANSLGRSTLRLQAWIIVDNGGDVRREEIATCCAAPVRIIAPGKNMGCGGALRMAEEVALQEYGATCTHVWILDDDAVVQPDSLAELLTVCTRAKADAVVPGVLDPTGALAWVPGLLDHVRLQAMKEPYTPEAYLSRWGREPLPFSWAQGIALLVRIEMLRECGLHRDDFWVRGEDLEFSLRLTLRGKGLFVPTAIVSHLPPDAIPDATLGEYPKHVALLRNVFYIAMRLPHGRRIRWTIGGNCYRFLRSWGWRPRAWLDGAKAFFYGALLARPAGR